MATHLIVFIFIIILLSIFFGRKIKKSSDENQGGSYSFDVMTPLLIFLYIVSIIVSIAIYGGIYWW